MSAFIANTIENGIYFSVILDTENYEVYSYNERTHEHFNLEPGLDLGEYNPEFNSIAINKDASSVFFLREHILQLMVYFK